MVKEITRKEEIVQKILKASVQEFLRVGFTSGSMENIAKVAEVSKRTLYKYFPTKDAVFDALIEELLEVSCGYFNVVYSKSESIQDQMKKIIDTKVSMLVSKDYIKISKLVLSEIIKERKISEEHLAKFYESELKFIRWIDAAKKDGKITSKQSSELISTQVHSIVKGQIFYPAIFGLKKITAKDIEVAKKLTLDFFINSFCK